MKNIREILTLAHNVERFTLVVAEAHEENTIIAVNAMMDLGLCDSILIGKKDKILEIIEKKQYNPYKYQIYDSKNDVDSAKLAVSLIKEGKADILMKGLIETKTLLKEVVSRDTGIRRKDFLSHITLISHPNLKKLIFATDCAMTLYPTVEEKIEIINNAVELLHILGYERPKVGLISAVEKVNPKLTSSYEAKEIVDHFNKIKDKKFVVDGPFAVDNVLSEMAAKHKGITSEVAGNADILVFPNLDSGNVFYKTSIYLAKAETAGVIVGAKVPIVLTSRADLSITKLYSIALAAVYQKGISKK
ncbi:MAG: bifunctional enoyl-CoA hydratase/phosphate acetyltransferase [Acholeplasmatales bacterium]